MPRAIWKGSIAFGLVNIPVELYSAVRDHRPKFRLLHAKDESPVQYERVCQTEGKPVGWEDLVKGYEYQKGQFVVLTKEDFKTAAVRENQDHRHPRLRQPERNRRTVLRDALLPSAVQGRRTSLCAVARGDCASPSGSASRKIILRDAQHLAAVEVIDDAIVLTMMRFADELADLADFIARARNGISPRS